MIRAATKPKLLPPLHQMVVELHARRPDHAFYATGALGGIFPFEALKDLDQAYVDLERRKLVEATSHIADYFGGPKRLYRATRAGVRYARSLG